MPDVPGIPGTRLPPAKDPRRDSPGPMPAVVPKQRDVRVEVAPLSRRESVFSALKPDRWAINIGFLLACGSIGGGGAWALNRETPAKPAVTVQMFEAEKAERVRNTDAVRALSARHNAFEDLTASALNQGPCVEVPPASKWQKPEWRCGGFNLQEVPSRRAIVVSTDLDPPRFAVKLDGERMPDRVQR